MAGFCPGCGTAREDGAEACGNCEHSFVLPSATLAPGGEQPEAADSEDEGDINTRTKWLTPKWIGIGMTAIALAGAGAWVATGNGGFLGLAPNVSTVVDVSLLPVSFGGKCGYVDPSGKMVINPQFDNAMAFNSKLGLAPVLVGEKWGLIDREGKYVVNPQFDDISANHSSDNMTVKLSGKEGTIDGAGKFIINPQFDSISVFDIDGNAVAKVGEKYGVIDSKGNFLISPEFEDIIADWSNYRTSSFKILGGLLLVNQQGKYGYVDRSGKIIIQPQYSAAGPFDSSGYAPAAIEEVDTEAFERTRDQNADVTVQLIRERLAHLILGDIRRNGLTVFFDLSNYSTADQVRVWLSQNIRQGRWNISSNVSRDPQGIMTGASITLEQILEAPKRSKYGYVDRTGKFIVSPQFQYAGNFAEVGLAPIGIGNATGYIDKSGKVMINPQWPRAEPFKQIGGVWLAIVGVSDEGSEKMRYGLIDSKGAYKINPQFDSLGTFSQDGFAVVQSGELNGAIDTAGHYVLQPIYTTLFPIQGTSKFVFVKPIAGTKDMQEIGVVDSAGKTITTVRGGTCGGIFSFS